MAQDQQGILRFIRGLFKDTSPIDQPMGTYRYAKNAVINDTSGSVSNEPGNKIVDSLPAGSIVIGTIPITDNRMVLCIKHGAQSEVGIYGFETYQTVLRLPPSTSTDTDLNFSPEHPISGTFKEQADGDLIVYWTDFYNPPRTLNITRQLQGSVQQLYGKNVNSSPDTKLVNFLNLFPHAGPVPHVELQDVYSGGGCRTGVYFLALAYADADFTETNYVTVANPVPIVDDAEGISPIESYDGAPPNTLTGKSITWNVSNINTGMKYLVPQVIQRIGGVDTAVQIGRVEINGRSNFTVTYSGENREEIQSSPDIVLVDNVEYTKVKTMEQLDAKLYLGNLEAETDIGYQPYANFIKSSPCTHVFDPFDQFPLTDSFLSKHIGTINDRTNGYRDPKNIFNLKGYQRDEVYAFYISFILKSGRMSYAYHIPGRRALENVDRTLMNELIGGESPNSSPPIINEGESFYGNGNGTVGDWDVISLTGQSDPQGYLYQWYDFSHLITYDSRGMNFWKNLHEFYPNTDDFVARNAQNPTSIQEDLRGQNVRHHRFPGNKNAEYTTVKSSNAKARFENIKSESKPVVHWFWFGGVDRSPLRTEGIYPEENFWEARDFQDDYCGNSPGMGGEGCSHSNISGALQEGPNACLPSANTQFMGDRGNVRFLDICNIGFENYDDLEYVYDTNIPVNKKVVIAFDMPCAILGVPHCSEQFIAQVTEVNGETVKYSHISGTMPQKGWQARPGWVAWVECDFELEDDPTNVLEHEVQALGICFDDIKIPKSIADKVQGFRIYYAKRTHENRTILGQAPIHPMGKRKDMDISGCDGNGRNIGNIDYWLPGGQPAITYKKYPASVYSFNDFYLLKNTPSLSQATHIRLQYVLCMADFKGHVEYNKDGVKTDVSDPSNQVYSCWKPEVVTSFHVSGDHYRVQNGISTNSRLNWVLEGKSKAYILGGSIFNGDYLGFENRIYNIGGHTHIALKPKRFLPYLASGQYADWREIRSDKSGISFSGYTDNSYLDIVPGTNSGNAEQVGLQLFMANLHAFKTDVYNRADDQELVWTGFEVTGSDIDRFVVDDNGTPIAPSPNFRTGKIFGGDTYICRYGYRMTHREEVDEAGASLSSGYVANLGSIDHKSIIMTIVESTENINFRHIENDKEPYFPGSSVKEVLKVPADVDLSYSPDPDTGKLRYNSDYSSVNDVKVVSPLPWVFEQEERFPVRVIRSSQATSSMLLDNYREYIATESRDLNNRYGELWKITAMANILLFHMEDALYQTKGKQQMQVSQGGQAYVGQGDIFEQLPDLVRHTDSGYIGTRSQFAAVSTPEGYFFVDNIDRKIFLLGDGVEDLSGQKYGMSNWLADNLPYELEAYGFHGKIDSFITGMGFHAVWDEYFGRVILTKRDLKPTEKFKELWKGSFNSIGAAYGTASSGIVYVNGTYYQLGTVIPGPILQLGGTELELDVSTQIDGLPLFERTGWTISFAFSDLAQGQKGFWESFHDYVPYMYSYAKTDVHSFTDGSYDIWRHNDYDNMGSFYGTVRPFEIEIISNMVPQIDKVYSSFNFLAEVKDRVGGQFLINDHHAGFDQYMTFGNNSSSGLRNIEYLVNIRKNGSEWSVNQFRDLSIDVTDTSPYLTGPYLGSNYILPGQNVVGGQNQGTVTAIPQSIFNVNGMNETVNPLYTDTNKPWYKQSKFIGKYMGIRLISKNSANKLINLYSVLADFRPYRR
jgi:hypothetical protein